MLGPQQSEFRCPCGTVVTGSEQLVQAAVEEHICTGPESNSGNWAGALVVTVLIVAVFAYYMWGA